ncbi:MAG: type 1 glutamine amidotransferase [Pseudomonadota bacterium]
MTNDIRFLVIDGYARDSRDELAAGGCSVAGELYAHLLRKHLPGALVDILYPSDPDAGLPSGTGLEDYDGIAWTGCNLTAYEEEPRVVSQIDLAKRIFEIGTPSFGSCWAAQIAVAAAGGIVRASPYGREMGIGRKISLTPEGRGHPMYAGKPTVFDAFISHVDEVTHLPPGSQVLAANNFSAVQSVCVTYKRGTFWAPQYHIEYDLHEMARLIACRKDKLMKLGFFRDGDQCEAYVAQLEALHQDPSRFDIAWALGIDDDVMREEVRERELTNWMEQQVLPRIHR